MQTKQKLTAGAVAALAVAGTLAATGPLQASATQTAGLDTCDLRSQAQILRDIYDVDDNMNVIVFRTGAFRAGHFNGIVHQGGTTEYNCYKPAAVMTFYSWVVFRDGEFTRQGDGGYQNWAFSGRFERNDTHVKFLAR
jgi:hypothetical protein